MSRWQLLGGLISLMGVLVILLRGDISQIGHLRFVAGDIYMIIATISWAFYGWLLTSQKDSDDVRHTWATMLLAQVAFGVVWSGVFAAGEWVLTDWEIQWSLGLVAAILYVSIGPAIIAFCCWGAGVKRVGPATAGFFANLIPLFAAILSVVFLGELPRGYHAVAFMLIVGGIVLSARVR